MLRFLLVTVLLMVGWALALRGPHYALLLYLWIAYFRPEQWVWTTFFQQLNLSYIAGVYLVLRSLFAGTHFRFDLRVGLLFAILGHSLVSSVLADNSAFSLVYFQDFAKSLVITYLIAVLATDITKLRLIVVVISVSLAFEAAKQGWAQLLLNPGGANTNEVPMFGDNNGVAVGMLMLVAFLVALARTAKKPRGKWTYRMLAIGCLYRAISTYSRGGFLAAAALGVVFLLRSQRKLLAIVGLALTAGVLLPVMPTEFWKRMDTITVEEGGQREASSAGRLHFWGVGWNMALDHPLFGVGHAGFNLNYDRYDPSKGAYGKRRSIHSSWLGLMAELGFVGFGLFAVILALAFLASRRTRRLARRGEVSKELGEFAIAIETALVVFAVGGTFVIFQYVEMLWHTIGLSIALNFLTADELRARQLAARPADTPAAAAGWPGLVAAGQRR